MVLYRIFFLFVFVWNKAFHFRKFISGIFLDCFILSMEALCSSEMVVTFYQPTLHNILESPSTLLWGPETLHFPHLICVMLHLCTKAEFHLLLEGIKCSSFSGEVRSWLDIYFLQGLKHKTCGLIGWSRSSSTTVVWQCTVSFWSICHVCRQQNAKHHQYPLTFLQSFHRIPILGSLFLMTI